MKDSKDNIIVHKSLTFAIRCVKLYKYLCEQHEYVMSKQLLRSGTSIGANVREASLGYTKADFAHKMSIAYKEAGETRYWFELLNATDYISDNQAQSLISDCDELLKILSQIIISSKSNMGSEPPVDP